MCMTNLNIMCSEPSLMTTTMMLSKHHKTKIVRDRQANCSTSDGYRWCCTRKIFKTPLSYLKNEGRPMRLNPHDPVSTSSVPYHLHYFQPRLSHHPTIRSMEKENIFEQKLHRGDELKIFLHKISKLSFNFFLFVLQNS